MTIIGWTRALAASGALSLAACGAAPQDEHDVATPSEFSLGSCDQIPSWECVGSSCTRDIVQFAPRAGSGYQAYHAAAHSWARKDLVQLVKYAAASTACLGAGVTPGIGGALGLGDMSERDGGTPRNQGGSLRHPQNTHVSGRDMDIAYFQLTSADNRLRAVCPHKVGAEDRHSCVGAPTNLDVTRTAIFIAKLHDSPDLRVVGTDRRIGPLIEGEIRALCSRGRVTGAACRQTKLAYDHASWHLHHHHHFHVSMKSRP